MLAVLLVVALKVFGQLTEERLQRDLHLVARAISLPVAQALERNDLAQVEASLASVFGISGVYGAYLFDSEGRRLIAFGAVRPTRRQAGEAIKLTAEGEFAQYERIRGHSVYSYFLPLFDAAGQPSGLLQVTRRRGDIDRELTRLKLWAWGGFALVSLLIVGGVVLGHRRAIGRPLSNLLDSIERVKSEGLGHRVDERGPYEICRLASGLNGMLDQIQSAERRASEQRTAREAMAERLAQAETMAALGQVSAGVAHELGAPISVVDGRAKRLLRRIENKVDREELDQIRAQASRMTAIVEQLLSYGRRSQAAERCLDVGSLLRRSAARLREEEGGSVALDPGQDAAVRGDSLGLEHALVNLMRNACQAAAGGRVVAGWSIDASCDQVVIRVEDSGPGIPAMLRDRIFEPFFTTKSPGEGSGLGLAIVHRVMREHHGEIRLAHSVLGGACFELRMGLAPGLDAARTTEAK